MSSVVDETDGAGAFADPAPKTPGRFAGMGAAERSAALALCTALALATLALTEPASSSGEGQAPALLRQRPPLVGGPFMAAPPFDPERRALNGPGRLPSEAPVQAEAPPAAPPLVLAGILSSGDTRKALFAGMDTWLPEGADAFGWHVVDIEPRRVTVRRGAEERILNASDALRP
ncbi:hypothetical protein [Aureimonas sp. D3]|uniref:hypothetical protein n=1 Tax=Aureimonas sp. D3 TaxID=1638164 RepID=UPI000781E69E|nr:hypothetical protein [Aureimonas sp. D3]